MKVIKYLDVKPIESPPGVFKREVLNAKDGAPNRMLVFEVRPGAVTPSHSHPWEHEVFFYAGKGVAVSGDKVTPVSAGSVVFVPPGEHHNFINKGKTPLRFIYVLPLGT